ncbi:MAG: methyltransferase domain-containing protein [Pirellulaceae bacterium]|nr:methyltransferase domain-containing protein [Pirellulaceae bacterium]
MFHPQGPTFWELAQQCLSSTERGYDLLAPKFDVTPFRTPDFVIEGLARCLGPPQSVDDGLDLCCGTGAAIPLLQTLCRRRVVGIDFSQGMLDVARSRLTTSVSATPVELLHANVLDMTFDREFDLAITVGSLGHILKRDEPRFVQRIHAALRPGGRFAFVTSTMPPWWSRRYLLSRAFNGAMHIRNLLVRPPFVMFYLTFLLPDVARLLESHGFKVAVHDDVYPVPFQELRVVVATRK